MPCSLSPSLRVLQTLCLAATGVAVGCKALPSQQTQQPTNPFSVHSPVIPPPATGSYSITNPSYTPPPSASAFAATDAASSTPTLTSNTLPSNTLPPNTLPSSTAPATVYGSISMGTPPTAIAPATVLGQQQQLDQGSPLPITSRAGTAQQGVASRLHDSASAVSSSIQTTTVGK